MNLPVDFINSIRSLLGEETEQLIFALTEDSPVSIRLNPFKRGNNPMEFTFPVQPVPWSGWGFYLDERPAFTFDPLFHSGYYYVQEASSMFIEYVVRQLISKPVTCLDLCAAPGGKSVDLLSALPEGSLLFSNEIVRQRASVLSETLIKFGSSNGVVTNNAPKDFAAFPHFFDLVLVDAPCSGEGMFRKDDVAVREWSADNVRMCRARQKDILNEVWPALKPGGLLVYSTCTYNIAENEENALWAVRGWGAEFVQVEINRAWGISPSFNNKVMGYRFFPHKTRGEGLFVTILRKPGSEQSSAPSLQKKNKKIPSVFIKDSLPYQRMLKNPAGFDFVEVNNRIIALPKIHSDTLLSLGEKLKVVSMGIEIGERKGKDFIPSHTLAMSRELNREIFFNQRVSYNEAISYLRNETIELSNAPKGFLLLTYKNEPLGFVKNLGNRANNLYPNKWRIRSSYLPEKPTVIFSSES